MAEERSCEMRLLESHDRLAVVARNNARLHEELAGLNRQLADANQRIGDLLHQVEHHKYVANHATELLENERAIQPKKKVKK